MTHCTMTTEYEVRIKRFGRIRRDAANVLLALVGTIVPLDVRVTKPAERRFNEPCGICGGGGRRAACKPSKRMLARGKRG